jgi:hypothetical protein
MPVQARRRGGGRGGRPGGKPGHGVHPHDDDRFPKGPQGVGVFSISASEPTLLGTIEKSRGVSIAPVSGLTAVYEGKLNETSSPTAKRLMSNGAPENMILLTSTSVDGTTWTEGALLSIADLPSGIIARRPTLSADGSLLFFVGASGNIKSTPSAIHVATCIDGANCTYKGLAFQETGKIISGCAFANNLLIVPYAGDVKTDDSSESPVPAVPTEPPVARRLLHKGKNKRGKKPKPESHDDQGRQLASQAWVATCDISLATPTTPACTSTGPRIEMPASSADATGRGAAIWRGSMIYNGESYEFYGSGSGNWPVVSRNGAEWSRVAADASVDLPGPDPSCAMDASQLVCAARVPRKGRRHKAHDDDGDGDDLY